MTKEMANGENPTEPTASEEVLLAEPAKAAYVDDDPILRSMIASWSEGQFDSFEVFSSGEEALQRFQQEDRPNILLTDGEMPRMNGLQLAQEVKKLDPTITTVLISGGIMGLNVKDEAVRKAHGVDFYLPKSGLNIEEFQKFTATLKATRVQQPTSQTP